MQACTHAPSQSCARLRKSTHIPESRQTHSHALTPPLSFDLQQDAHSTPACALALCQFELTTSMADRTASSPNSTSTCQGALKPPLSSNLSPSTSAARTQRAPACALRLCQSLPPLCLTGLPAVQTRSVPCQGASGSDVQCACHTILCHSSHDHTTASDDE